MRLYIIRHGETEWNKLKRLQGQTDIALNETGRSLAFQVGTAMKDIPFTRVISSPLSRAVETAAQVLAGAGRELKIETDPRILEISFGEWEGYSTLNPEYANPDFETAGGQFHYFFDAPEKYRAPRGGEDMKQLLARTGDFLEELARARAGEEETILVSSHGAAVRALLANIKHTPLKDFWKPGVPKNCSVSIARRENGIWKLEKQDEMYYE